MLPPRGAFVVVVVVVADKESGTPSGTSCRLPRSVRGGKIQGRAAQTSSEPHPQRWFMPTGEGKVAGLAALAAVTLAAGCQIRVTRYQ